MESNFDSATRIGSSPDFDLRFSPLHKTLADISSLIAEGQETHNTPRLADVVSSDPILALYLLRRINSVFLNVQRPIDDVPQAVRMLGFREVCNIARLAGKADPDDDVLMPPDQMKVFGEIMMVSVGASFLVREIAGELNLTMKGNAFTVGLQHAVGRLVLLQNRPRAYVQLWNGTVNDFGPRAVHERKVFGTDHAELGARALKWWNIPESITTVIGHYIRPGVIKGEALRNLAMALSLAVSAAEQVCMHLSGRGGRPFFTPPSKIFVRGFARSIKSSPPHLIRLVESKRDEALDYIKTMMRG